MKRIKLLLSLAGLLFLSYPSFSADPVSIKTVDNRQGVYNNVTNEWIIPNRYDGILPIKGGRYAPVDFYRCQSNGLYAIFTAQGQRITEFAFEQVNEIHYGGVFIVRQNNQYGMVDVNGYVVLPCEYTYFTTASDGLHYKKGSQSGVLAYSDIPRLRKEAIAKGEKYLYNSEENDWAIRVAEMSHPQDRDAKSSFFETQHTRHFNLNSIRDAEMSPCINGYFTVKEKNGDIHIFDKAGNHTFTYRSPNGRVPVFNDKGTTLVRLDGSGSLCLIKADGSVVKKFEKVDEFSGISDGFAVILANGKDFITIDAEGNIIDKVKYKKELDFSASPRLVITDASGKAIMTVMLCAITEDSRLWGERIEITPLVEGFRLCFSNQGYIYLDNYCRLKLKGNFYKAHHFSEGLAAVAIKDGEDIKWGFIDTSGKFVIEPKFSNEPGDFSEGYALVRKKDNTVCYIDRTGKPCFEGLRKAAPFFGGYAIVQRNNNNYILVDKSFNPVRYVSYDLVTSSHREGLYCCAHHVWAADGVEVFSPYSDWFSSLEGSDIYLCVANRQTGYATLNGELAILFTESEF